ncbi:MAG: HAD family hydrolase [Spirochaetales bacterium]|nr:MAG: HAD family hydrolase [Spirochaetales bacterium]
MKLIERPVETRAALFDIDGTLYTNHVYGQFQIDILIEELACTRGESVERVRAAIERTRAAHASTNNGAATSLGNAMASLGVDMATSVAWRQRLIDPTRFLQADPKLRIALLALCDRGLVLAAVTNNPRSVGEATLRALGVQDLFTVVVGLDDTMKSKPAREPYLLAARLLCMPVTTCLSVGDRYDVDLAFPLELGMGAVLVDGVEDVYRLPGTLFG